MNKFCYSNIDFLVSVSMDFSLDYIKDIHIITFENNDKLLKKIVNGVNFHIN